MFLKRPPGAFFLETSWNPRFTTTRVWEQQNINYIQHNRFCIETAITISEQSLGISHSSNMQNTFIAMMCSDGNFFKMTLQWRHNDLDGVSKTGISVVYSTVCSVANQRKHQSTAVTREFPPQMSSNTENVSIWWRHHRYLCFGDLPRTTLLSTAPLTQEMRHTCLSLNC